jgi:hypothetical protein
MWEVNKKLCSLQRPSDGFLAVFLLFSLSCFQHPAICFDLQKGLKTDMQNQTKPNKAQISTHLDYGTFMTDHEEFPNQ